jgi:hypothetical protein
MERLARDKRSGFLGLSVGDAEKMFSKIDTWRCGTRRRRGRWSGFEDPVQFPEEKQNFNDRSKFCDLASHLSEANMFPCSLNLNDFAFPCFKGQPSLKLVSVHEHT